MRRALLAVALLVAVPFATAAPTTQGASQGPTTVASQGPPDCRPHPPIVIDGDPVEGASFPVAGHEVSLDPSADDGALGFTVRGPATGTAVPRPGSGVVAGSGTAEDPYVIEGWCIAVPPELGPQGLSGDVFNETDAGIAIADTDAHVVVRDNVLLGTGDPPIVDAPGNGIVLSNVTNVRIADNEIRDVRFAVDGTRIEDTIVVGNEIDDIHRFGIRIRAEDIAVRDNAISNVTKDAVNVVGSDVEATDNRIDRAEDAIRLTGDGNRVDGNTITQVLFTGIAVLGDRNEVTHNTVRGAGVGVFVDESVLHGGDPSEDPIGVANDLVDNRIADSEDASVVIGDATDTRLRDNRMDRGLVLGSPFPADDPSQHIRQDVDTSNTVGGDPVVYLLDEDGARVTGPAGQVIVAGSDDVTVTGLETDGAAAGVQVVDSAGVTVEESALRNATVGLTAHASPDLDVVDVEATEAGCTGLTLRSSPSADVRRTLVDADACVPGTALEIVESPDTQVSNTTLSGYRHQGADVVASDRTQFTDVQLDPASSAALFGIDVRDSASVEVHGSNIPDHDTGVRGPGEQVDATHNWWGCPDGPDDPACSDAGSDVDVDPWLTAPNPDAGPG